MKRTIGILSFLIAVIALMAFENGTSRLKHSSGASTGYCGDPAGGNKTCTSCHTGPNAATQAGWISSNIPAAGYVPGTTYTITATATRAGHSKFGFEISSQNTTGGFLGALVSTDAQTQVSANYITHTNSGTSGSGTKAWTFNWTAPAKGSGKVTFYGAFCVTNSDNSKSGDTTYISALAVSENTTTGTANVYENKKEVSVFPNPASDHLNIVYTVDEPGHVEINLINMNGSGVQTLLSENTSPSTYNRSFNISGKVSPGNYLVKITIGQLTSVEKIILK